MSINRKIVVSGITAPLKTAAIPSPHGLNGGPWPVAIYSHISGVGAVSATIDVYGLMYEDDTDGAYLQTHPLSGVDKDTVGDGVIYPWPFFYFDIKSISGTNAAVTIKIAG